MVPEFTNSAPHPGRVTVVEPDGSESVQSAESLPEWMRFVQNRDGRFVPVVLIARVRSGFGFTLRSYGTDGRLLAVTTSPDGTPVRPAEITSGWF